ncbi:hypothetical protein [Streptomyces sp. CJ_13]|uniref:hypothetical protein n=1 Tax=Streptomyces sp. CJ_13 TaxID=2724943 RepID=UPI001BDC84A7|nr:hypothetical protein [Streptomyces sp. CJ_13]
MAPRRVIDEGTAAGELALYLVKLVKGAKVRDLAQQFGRSSSAWGNYLNGAQVIPKPELRRLLEAYTPAGPVRNAAVVRAGELWKAASLERRLAVTGGDLVRQHQRREDALEQVIKYQDLAAKAEKHLAELRPMLVYSKIRLENAQLQLRHAREQEQARLQKQLGLAKERLSRVRTQQERAQSRRMTAEEQQEFWMGEVLAAQADIEYLEGQVQDIAVPETSVAPVAQDTMDDTEFDHRLEHIEAESAEDEAAFEAASPPQEDTRPEDRPPLSSPVQDLSNTALDKSATSTFPATGQDGAQRAELLGRFVSHLEATRRNRTTAAAAGVRAFSHRLQAAPQPAGHGREISDRQENPAAPRPADATASTPPPIPSARTGPPESAGSSAVIRPRLAQAGAVTAEVPARTENPARLSHRLREAWDSTQAVGVILGGFLLFCLLSGFGTAYGAALRAEPGPSVTHLLLFAGFALVNDALVVGAAVRRQRKTGEKGLLSIVYLGVAAQFISTVLSSFVDQPGATWMADVIGLL